MNEGNPDDYGYPGDHEPNCRINVHGGSGKDCDCSYRKNWIGDTPEIEIKKDYSTMARGANYPFDDDIDYDPRIDNADEDNMQFGLEL